MKERILPGIGQALQVEQIRLFAGLTGVEVDDLGVNRETQEINRSLESYADKVNRLGLLPSFVMEYHFNRPRGWIAGDWGNFFLDASRGFLIQERPDNVRGEESPAMAAIAFSIFGLDNIDPGRYPNLDFLCLKPGDVLVAQIQSQKGLNREQQAKLKKIRWERSLLETVFGWAEETNLSRVLVVPAANNYWLTDAHCQAMKTGLEKRLFLRYDVTARRCGFKQTRENEPYCQETLRKRTHDALWGH